LAGFGQIEPPEFPARMEAVAAPGDPAEKQSVVGQIRDVPAQTENERAGVDDGDTILK
jgi:hypothetical protein